MKRFRKQVGRRLIQLGLRVALGKHANLIAARAAYARHVADLEKQRVR